MLKNASADHVTLQANCMLFVAYSMPFSEVLVLMSGCIKGIRAGQCSNDKEWKGKVRFLHP